jgi:hypothetical protein
MTEPIDLMLRDYAVELVHRLRQAQGASGSRGTEVDVGHKLGLRSALSLLVHQAQVFGIPLADLGIDGVDPDQFA